MQRNQWILCVTLAATACGGGTTSPTGAATQDESCSNNDGCEPGLACYEGSCRKPCNTNRDCTEVTQHCDQGYCAPGTAIACGNGEVQAGEGCDDAW